jgi:hypothetical protein
MNSGYNAPYPTDIFHRATLIHSAMTPLHNHILIVLPATREDIKPLHNEILSFLWTKTIDAKTVHKRRLVERRRLSASFRKSGLHIQHPEETADVLHINLIHK